MARAKPDPERAPAPDPEEALAWERSQRKPAGLAGVLAGVLLLLSTIYAYARLRDGPKVTLTDGLRDVLGQPPAQGPRGLLTASAQFLDSHAFDVLATSALSALGTLLIAPLLGYLFRATQARRPGLTRLAIYAALLGPVLFALGPLLSAISVVDGASGYVGRGVFSTPAAHDALRSGSLLGIGGLLSSLGGLLTALAFVLISLNAMRVGLLTRFLGILGIIAGVLVIFPQVGGTPIIVECFWLAFVGMLILGRGRAAPPAWHTGRAEPWPSQQELRERAADGQPESEPEPSSPRTTGGGSVAVGGVAAPVRRKRKRR